MMNNEDFLSISVLQARPNMAIQMLARRLRSGSLALAVGAGASAGLGLPNWYQLVNRCLRKAAISAVVSKRTSNDTLRSLVRQIEEKLGNAYMTTVRDALYEKTDFTDDMLTQELLIALGACLMGSGRGSITEVLNFNFDNVLDWYLNLHGYTTQIISEIPSLRKDVDVTIYHPHGYLPKDDPPRKFSRFLVFSQESYDQKVAKFETDPWIAHFRHTLRNREVIFVGLSGEDPLFGPLLGEIYPSVRKWRHIGFWLFGPNAKPNTVSQLKSHGIVPLQFKTYGEIPKFLLKVCQQAAKDQ